MVTNRLAAIFLVVCMVIIIPAYANELYPAISSDVTTGLFPLSVQFTDESTTFNATIDSWYWEFGDGNTSSSQNPEYEYMGEGDFDTTLTITNTSFGISNTSAPLIISPYSPTGLVMADLFLEPGYTLTLHIVDGNGAPIPVCTVLSSVGAEYTTTNGTAYLSTSPAVMVVYVSSEGYISKQMSYVMDKDRTETIQLSDASDSPMSTTIYYPHHVRFSVMDITGQPIEGVNVTATAVESTVPWEWLLSFLGINTEKIEIQNTTLAGSTGTDGSWTASMVEVVRYSLVFSNETKGIYEEITLYPKEDNYVIVVSPSESPNSVLLLNGTLTDRVLNSTHDRLQLDWVDMSGTTTNLTFIVRHGAKADSPVVYSTSIDPTGNVTLYHDVPSTPGDTYVWGFIASNSQFTNPITKFWFVTFEDREFKLVDLHIPDYYYNWITIAMLVVLAGLFGATTRRFGVVFLPLWASFCKFIGWFPAVDWIYLAIAVVLGVLIYIRSGEREQHL